MRWGARGDTVRLVKAAGFRIISSRVRLRPWSRRLASLMCPPASQPEALPLVRPEPVAAGGRSLVWLLAGLLALVTLALYWPAIHCNFVNCDDNLCVTDNPHVQAGLSWGAVAWAWLNPVNSNWHPLTVLSHMLDCQLFGLRPWGHHLTSVLLHSLNTVLVFLLLRRLTGATWRSLWVAALFGWHPLHVESVAWIAERKDMLSTAFGLLSLLCYARYAQSRSVGERDSRLHPARDYSLALLFLALGLMSKAMLVTWPFVMLLLDYWPLGRFQSSTTRRGRLLVEKIPFLVLAGAASVFTYLVQKQAGALTMIDHLPLGARAENALVSCCRYLGKLFWPAHLAIFYPHPGYWPLEQVLLAAGLLLVLSVLLVAKARQYPFLLGGWLWYCGTLVPVIQLVQTGSHAMADRYTYVPSLGLLVLVAWGAGALAGRWRHGVAACSVAAAALLLLCLPLTRRQISYWQDSQTLFRHALAVTEDNPFSRNNLGTALMEQGQMDEAISQFQQALHLKPEAAMAHYNLGTALAKAGQTQEAIGQLREAIRLEPDNVHARNNLGRALVKAGQLDEAISQFQQALRLQPDYAQAHYNLGTALGMKGQSEAAIGQFQLALLFNPDDADSHNNLGNSLRNLGRIGEAIGHYQAALRLKPADAEFQGNLGTAFAQNGQLAEAIGQFREAVRLAPTDAQARNHLGTALARDNQLDGAIVQFQEAVRLQPNEADAHRKLGTALIGQGQTNEAILQFQQAVHLSPDDAEALNYLGYLWAERGQNLDQARALLERAVRLQPKNAAFLDSLGWTLLKLHRPREALDCLRQSIADSAQPRALLYDHLGDVYAALGQREEALAAWRQALALTPNPDIQRKLAPAPGP
jgi:protein O-mannosyl-transferase